MNSYVMLALSIVIAMATIASLAFYRQLRLRNPQQKSDSLDTVMSWPPQVVRVLTLAERQAYDNLKRAVPGHLVLAQVPLSRFISVPTRNPYQVWLQRAGRLSVDLLVCDFSSRPVAAIELRNREDGPRAAKRHRRLTEVLRAAGLEVHEWYDDAMPSVTAIRSLFIQKNAGLKEVESVMDKSGRKVLPVAESAEINNIEQLLQDGDASYGNDNAEPVPSGFYFDDSMVGIPAEAANDSRAA
jgi:Protein of unknown function (DUF2726)